MAGRAARPVHVFRLDVAYPPGSQEPGWEPPGWDPDLQPWNEGSFSWPRNRRYLSRKGAEQGAGMFRKYGAKVEIVPSLPGELPAQDAAS